MKFLCFLLFCVLNSLALGQGLPQWQGLPDELPMDYISQVRMLEFTQTSSTVHAPFGLEISFNQKPIPNSDRGTLGLVFAEYFFAVLPKAKQIQILNRNDRTVWDYPTGSQIVHLILFRTSPLQVFEMRMEQKLANGQWAFGIYSPVGNRLVLNKYTGLRPESYQIQLVSGERVEISLKHLNLLSCRNCHLATSPSSYQYPSVDFAGPCGFGPANPGIVGDWAKRYTQVHGESPFPPSFRRR